MTKGNPCVYHTAAKGVIILFELGVITDEISDDLEHALAVAAEYGLKQAELRAIGGRNLADLADQEVKRVKEMVDQSGFQVCAIASPLFKCALPGMETREEGPMHQAEERGYDDQMDLLRHVIDLAHLFETRIIRVFAFWRVPMTDQVWKQIREAFEEPVKLAEKEDLILGLENEGSCCFGTGAEVAKFVGEVNSPHLRVVWDPGNAFGMAEVAYPDGYQQVKPCFCHFHVKDMRRDPATGKTELTVVGEGEVDYRGQFQALVDDGYDGVVSLETHYRPASGSAEEGSRSCLESMKKIIAEISSHTGRMAG